MSVESIIIGGPNGAGKSTLAYEYLQGQDLEYLSADRLAQQIAPDHPEKARVQAGKVFFRRLDDLIERQESFVVESTLAGCGMKRVIERLGHAGFHVRLAFVFLDTPALCIRRVKQRVQQGGHDVPTEDIVRRFYRSKLNFWNVYRHIVDRWYLFYNAEDSFQEVAVGEGEGYAVTDEVLFERFQEDIT